VLITRLVDAGPWKGVETVTLNHEATAKAIAAAAKNRLLAKRLDTLTSPRWKMPGTVERPG
jgi:hypothetical protein